MFELIQMTIEGRYKRVSRKVKHGRVFESIRTSIEEKMRTSIKSLNTDECLNRYGRVFGRLTQMSVWRPTQTSAGFRLGVLILLGIEKVKVIDWGFWE